MIEDYYRQLFGVPLPDRLDGLDTANLGPGGLRTEAVLAYVRWCDAGRRYWRLQVTRGTLAATQAADDALAAQRDYEAARRDWDSVTTPAAVQLAAPKPKRGPEGTRSTPRRYDFLADLDAALAVL